MTPRFPTRWDILPPPQRRLWADLWAAPQLGLVLYGGTAIGLRLGHRPSIHFDFFTERRLDRTALQSAFAFVPRAATLQETANTWSLLVPGAGPSERPVQISFFGAIFCGRVGAPEYTDDGGMQVAALPDLMAFKVKVILQRAEAKDYVDIAAMLQAGVSLELGLAAARTMFHPTFQPLESLKALTCFEGGDLETLTAEVQTTLVRAARAVGKLPRVELASQRLGAP